MLTVKIKKLVPEAIIPQYAHGPEEDAGMDLCAVGTYYLKPGEPMLIKTGLAIELPPYYEAQIRPRGGLALKNGLQVVNSPGTVDPAYRGEIGVILLWNGFGPGGYMPGDSIQNVLDLHTGDRIAQMVITKYEPIQFQEVDFLNDSNRGAGAYGSTGIGQSTYTPFA